MIFTQSVANGYQAYSDATRYVNIFLKWWKLPLCLCTMLYLPIRWGKKSSWINTIKHFYYLFLNFFFSKSFQLSRVNWKHSHQKLAGLMYCLCPAAQQQHLQVPCYYSLWSSKDFWAHYYRIEHNSVSQWLIMVTAACFQDAFTLWNGLDFLVQNVIGNILLKF